MAKRRKARSVRRVKRYSMRGNPGKTKSSRPTFNRTARTISRFNKSRARIRAILY